MTAQVFPNLQGHNYMSLATFRKSGQAVPTPVWFADAGDRLYVVTERTSGKVKRLRNNHRVTIAPSDMRGEVLGEAQDAEAVIVSDDEQQAALTALKRKYGFQYTLFGLMARLRGQKPDRVFLAIKPAG